MFELLGSVLGTLLSMPMQLLSMPMQILTSLFASLIPGMS